VAAAIGSGSLSLSLSVRLFISTRRVCDKATKRLHSFFAGWLLLLLLLALWVYV
jgi:hypothetical protein